MFINIFCKSKKLEQANVHQYKKYMKKLSSYKENKRNLYILIWNDLRHVIELKKYIKHTKYDYV